MLQGGTTLAPGIESPGISADQINAMIAQYLADNPTAALRTIEGLDYAPPNPVDNQIIFIDSEMDSVRNGIYGFKSDRNWKRIGKSEINQ